MDEFTGAYGDKRRAAAITQLSKAIVATGSVVIREVGGDRKGELSAHRVLGSCHVTPQDTVECVARRTATACAGRRIVVPQDTSEFNYAGRLSRGLGPAGRTGKTPGFFMHAAVAVEADEEAVLGLVEAHIWTRHKPVRTPRRQRDAAAKESSRWLRTAHRVSQRLASAAQIIMVGDRENDIYAAFAGRPAATEMIVRAAQDRLLTDGSKLFATTAKWRVLGRQKVLVPIRMGGDKTRTATVSLRAGTVRLPPPLHARRGSIAPEVQLTMVEAIETAPPPGAKALHWRLWTTLPARNAAEAAEVVRLYRLRWRIEQVFRMLKNDGLRLHECQTHGPWRLFNLAALAADAAVKIIQMVDARDGSKRPASDVAGKPEIAAAIAVCPTLEGKTERQRNPHPEGTLSWLSWIVARLGGWNCYYKPPGPKTFQRGWDRLKAIAHGFTLATGYG
jgi:hypothetical protein